MLAGEKDPAQIDVVRPLPDVDVELMHWRIFADELDGGASEEHIQTAMATPNLIERGGDTPLVGDIGHQRERLPADLLDRRL